ncbi:hypothetical protein H1C71_002206 [Ictidomys tridecemlineatus]|nr:hypothetical protein H1C71_002206 [Ictidomys tridecemlineatus]
MASHINLYIKKTCKTMEYYSALKNNKIMAFAGKWMALVQIMLSEVSQSPQKINAQCLLCYKGGDSKWDREEEHEKKTTTKKGREVGGKKREKGSCTEDGRRTSLLYRIHI